MNKIRTWVGGLSISAPCVFFTLAMTPGLDPTASGPVHGRVTYNGRPLEGGYILFEPMEMDSNQWAVGAIERGGSYSIDLRWRRGNQGKERFLIAVVPKHWTPATPAPSPSEGASPDNVPMSLGSKDPDSCQSTAMDCGFPKRFTNARTSGLHVTLGREPARVDIDLKD
jgi:hypothetical protein